MESSRVSAQTDLRREVFAVTLTVDISGFSLAVGDAQERWYKRLRNILRRVLTREYVEISVQVDGTAFWSPGGDGGTVSIIEGGISKGLDLAIGIASELYTDNGMAAADDRFELTMGIDYGPAVVGIDVDGRANVWGEAINTSNRTSLACEPGYILATKRYVDAMLAQRESLNEIVSRPHRRLVKHGKIIEVLNVYDPHQHAGTPISKQVQIDVADFEAPYLEMVDSYRNHLHVVMESRNGIWTLLLAARLHEIGQMLDEEFKYTVSTVSKHGSLRDRNAPFDPFFSSLGERALQKFMAAGAFVRFNPDAVISVIGDPARDLFIVARGRIGVRVGPTTVARREPGDVVGEMALVEPGTLRLRKRNPTRTATMVAETAVTLFSIPYSAVRASAKQDDEVAATFVRIYRERKKESALQTLLFFQFAEEKEKAYFQSIGQVFAVALSGNVLPVQVTTVGLVVCCQGRGRVESGGRFIGLTGEPMQCAWISAPETRGRNKEIRLIGGGSTEFIIWHGKYWDEWVSKVEAVNGPLNTPDRVTGIL